MYEKLLYIITLILGYPFGIYLAWLCKDEVKAWKTRLIIISIIGLISSVVLYFFVFSYKFQIILTLFFIIITCLTIVWKTNLRNIYILKSAY